MEGVDGFSEQSCSMVALHEMASRGLKKAKKGILGDFNGYKFEFSRPTAIFDPYHSNGRCRWVP